MIVSLYYFQNYWHFDLKCKHKTAFRARKVTGMFKKWLLACFTRLAWFMPALFLHSICIGSLQRWWGLGSRNWDLRWPEPAGSPGKQALSVSVKLTTILVKFGLSCYKKNWFLWRNEVEIKRFVYNRRRGLHQICYVQNGYANYCLFLYIATFICKHEILMR